MRRLIVLVCVVGTLAGLASPASASIASEEDAFVAKINYSRKIRGLRTLRERSHLTYIARRHSRRMAAAGDIFHNSSLSRQVEGDWKSIGENVGRGSTVYRIHRAFMDSTPHRANILYSRFDSVGVGVAHAGGRIYVTQVFANY